MIRSLIVARKYGIKYPQFPATLEGKISVIDIHRQGLNECSAQATCTAMELASFTQYDRIIELDEQELWKNQGANPRGDNIEHAMSTAHHVGVTDLITKEVVHLKDKVLLKNLWEYQFWARREIPIIIRIPRCNGDNEAANVTGYIDLSGEPKGTYHYVVIIHEEKDYFVYADSKGKQWGYKGTARIKKSDFNKISRGYAVIV